MKERGLSRTVPLQIFQSQKEDSLPDRPTPDTDLIDVGLSQASPPTCLKHFPHWKPLSSPSDFTQEHGQA